MCEQLNELKHWKFYRKVWDLIMQFLDEDSELNENEQRN